MQPYLLFSLNGVRYAVDAMSVQELICLNLPLPMRQHLAQIARRRLLRQPMSHSGIVHLGSRRAWWPLFAPRPVLGEPQMGTDTKSAIVRVDPFP